MQPPPDAHANKRRACTHNVVAKLVVDGHAARPGRARERRVRLQRGREGGRGGLRGASGHGSPRRKLLHIRDLLAALRGGLCHRRGLLLHRRLSVCLLQLPYLLLLLLIIKIID